MLPRPTASISRTVLRFSMAIVIGVAAWNCGGGTGPGGRVHTLRIPDPPAAAAPTSKLVIGVEHFSAVTPLNDWRILKYESPTQLKYYDEDRWVSEPTTMIPELAAQFLERMGIARQAGLLPWVEKMDYVLQGQVLSFEEIRNGDQHAARVAIELTLLRFPKRELVWTGTFRAQQPVAGDDIPAAVEALSLATHEVLRSGFTDLAQNLKQQP
jgi:ABC-type uncharacterized transport system auxiliary subunit